jgi:hypothetical protein
MGVFDALNARIVAAIDRRSGRAPLAGVTVADGRLRLTFAGGRVLDLPRTGLRRVVALRRDVYAGDQVSLLLEFEDARIVEVASSVPGWSALAQSIDSLDGSRGFGQWHAEAMAAPMGEAIPVWSREGVDDGRPAPREPR